MWAVFFKEIKQFFSSLIGYLAIIVFLLLLGLFLWIFPDYSILDYGYATLESFFYIAPYVLILLIPAITMRMFAEEIHSGTIEILSTQPLTEMDIVLGKFFASLALVFIAIIPTLFYFYSVYQLALPIGNVDVGGTIGSYFGLLFLGAAFCSIGIFCSSLTTNQIVAFMLSVFLCLFLYLAFSNLAKLTVFFGKSDFWVEQIGLQAHYLSISKGIVDSRDVIYFLSVIALFILLTRTSLSARKW